MTLSTTSLTFAATDAGTPAGQTVTANFSGTGSGTLYILIAPAGPANPALVSVGNIFVNGTTSGQATVTPAAPATFGAGTHTTTITVTACLNDPTCKTNQIAGSPQTINVTYTVAGVAASVAAVSYAIGNAPVAADYTQTFSVTGYPTQTWTAAITNAPWLSLSPSTGSTGGAVTVQASLDKTQVSALANGTYTGTVALSTPTGIGVSIPVTLTVATTKVDFVAPYVGTSNVSDSIVIRGEHFSLVTPTGVNFGTTPASTFNVVSDSEIHATYPALPAGTYPVQLMAGGASAGTSRAQLVVVDPPAFASATLPYAVSANSRVSELVYDAQRQALLLEFFDNTLTPAWQLRRFAYGAGSWGAATAAGALQASDFTLSIDGSELLVAGYDATLSANGEAAVRPLDPATLQPTGTEAGLASAPGNGVSSVAVANDGQAIFDTTNFTASGTLSIYTYAQLSGMTTAIPPVNPTLAPVNAVIGASADGATVLAVSNTPNATGGPPVLKYDSSSGTLTPLTSTAQAASISIDRHGTRVLLNATGVYDPTLTLLGSLPASSLGAVLSPDARRAYTYDSAGTVRVFDLTAATAAGLYPEITPAKTLPGSPAASSWAKLAVSPDGGTLFVAIGAGVYVVPLP